VIRVNGGWKCHVSRSKGSNCLGSNSQLIKRLKTEKVPPIYGQKLKIRESPAKIGSKDGPILQSVVRPFGKQSDLIEMTSQQTVDIYTIFTASGERSLVQLSV